MEVTVQREMNKKENNVDLTVNDTGYITDGVYFARFLRCAQLAKDDCFERAFCTGDNNTFDSTDRSGP